MLAGLEWVYCAPVSGKRRIEHRAEPVNDGFSQLVEKGGVDVEVVVSGTGQSGELAARHENHPTPRGLDQIALFFIGMDHVLEGASRSGCKLIGRGATHDKAFHGPGLASSSRDQVGCALPAEAHPALRRIHGLSDS